MEDLVILYEDNHVLVTVKPQNIPTQADSSGDEDMLTAVKKYIAEKENKPGNVYIGLIHRLDRPTGGVMAFAKTSKAAARLSEQIKEGEFEKRYFAVGVGIPRDRRARLVNYLIKDEEHNMVRLAPAAVEGSKKAILDYTVVENMEGLSLFDIKLLTGRSHQIRVQLKGIGCPIYGDARYGTSAGGHLALWAYSLRFLHPVTKQIMVFKVFPPVERRPWKYFAIERHINVVKPE